MKSLRGYRFILALSTALAAVPVVADAQRPATLEQQFRVPPSTARPRVWWHWMNGNVTKDGIAKDMAWMKRVGIGGLQNFDANIATPQIVDKRLTYMSPEWKDAFRFAAREADRLGLELTIASSPGWSETGGPWVKPEDGLKKLVWSEAMVSGGGRVFARLPQPPSIVGPFGTLKSEAGIAALLNAGDIPPPPPPYYADVAVFAVPDGDAEPRATPAYTDASGKPIDGAAAMDRDFETAIEIPRSGSNPPAVHVSYGSPQTIRSATLFMPGSASILGGSVVPRLDASEDGKTWRPVAELPAAPVPTTAAFAPVTARYFRLVFNPPMSGAVNFAPPAPGVDAGAMGAMFAMTAPAALKLGYLRLSPVDRIDRAEMKAGFSVVLDYYALSQGLPDTRGIAPSDVIDLTGRMRPDGTLEWVAPKGKWRILRLGYSLTGTMNHPAAREATGLEVDKFDAAAVRRYLGHYIGMYKDAAGADFVGRNGVRAILNDSIEVGAANWTPDLIAQFTRLRGYDPRPWFPALTGIIIGSRSQSDKFLYDFRRTLGDLMASEHYGTIAKVAHENGLKVYGEALESLRANLGDDMAIRRHADIPMAAMWTFPRQGNPVPAYLADIKGAASVAHIYGQNLVAAESMTSLLAPWAFGPNDLKEIIDLEFVTGVNRPVVHTSVHVPVDGKKPGLTLSVFGQYFNRNESWAELATPWVDYMARNSLLLQQGRNVADIAYFYGEEAPLTALYLEKRVPDAPRSVAYDFINADALMGAVSNDGSELVTPGGARYRALYLGGSSRMMTLETLRKLATLVEGGATVIGAKPVGNPSLVGDANEFAALTGKLWGGGPETRVGKGRVLVAADAEAALAQAGIAPDFGFTGGQPDSDIPFLHRKLDDGDSYFLVNRKARAETIEARFRVTGKAPELWHAETGTSEPISYRIENGETIVPLALDPLQSVHVVFRKPAQAQSLRVAKPLLVEIGRIAGPWKVAFEANRGAPAAATFESLAPLDKNADAGIKYFSGIATYAASFLVPKSWKRGQPLWLDLGEAKEVAEVTVNGRLAGYAWHAPYRIDVGKVARPGRNSLGIRVANLWVNRLVGDRQPGATKVAWIGGPGYTEKAPLRRSGLIGPVTLMSSR